MQPQNETPAEPKGNVTGLAQALIENGFTPDFVRAQAPGDETWEEIATAMETTTG